LNCMNELHDALNVRGWPALESVANI
jgi:hypothetical protein